MLAQLGDRELGRGLLANQSPPKCFTVRRRGSRHGTFRKEDGIKSALSSYHAQQGCRFSNGYTIWKLDQDDIAAVEAIVGKGVLKSDELTIQRGYYSRAYWNFDCDEEKGFENLLENSKLHSEEKGPLRQAGSIRAAKAAMTKRKSDEDEEGADVPSAREQQLLETIDAHYGEKENAWQAIVDILSGRLPKMVYFGSYMTMPGQISINDLNTRSGAKKEPGNKVFLALLGLINRSPSDCTGSA